jgi:hypothetical protein
LERQKRAALPDCHQHNGSVEHRSPAPGECLSSDPAAAKEARIETAIGCHTFRHRHHDLFAQRGSLEKAQQMAAHPPGRPNSMIGQAMKVSLDEVERVVF